MEIECGTDPQHDGAAAFATMQGHPDFLLGRSQAHPDQVRLCRADLLAGFLILLRS
jgi:hypothetical protein